MIDFERGAKTSGSKFYFLTDEDAIIEWDLMNEMIRYHHDKGGYRFVIPPYFVKYETAEWAGILPRFQGQFYDIPQDGLIAIPTAETALVGMHANEIFKEDQLPIKYVAFSPCFRREAGAAGMKTKGLKRVHQFHKIELFEICTPENSENEHQNMVEHVKRMIHDLYPEVEYRVIELEEHDRSPVSNKTYDVEMKFGDEWLEVSSISNMGDNQSKPAQIRYKPKNGKKNVKVHMLNGSALALPRLRLALGVGENIT
jgi:seryl-tRNA synthetase